jgi:hypothetical protein
VGAALEAVALGYLGDRAALKVLDDAQRYADADTQANPVWPWVFPFDSSRVASYRAIAASRLGLVKVAMDAFDQGEAARSPKQAALVAVEHARVLATGGHQIFARAILDVGGRLEVIVPAAQYRDGLPETAHAGYDALLAAASKVDRLSYVESTEEAHMAASQAMLASADRLYAVWDGQPARGYGGTADVVAEAEKLSIPVTVIWPEGAVRDEAA